MHICDDLTRGASARWCWSSQRQTDLGHADIRRKALVVADPPSTMRVVEDEGRINSP